MSAFRPACLILVAGFLALLTLFIVTVGCAILAYANDIAVMIPGLVEVSPEPSPGVASATFAPVGSVVWYLVLTAMFSAVALRVFGNPRAR